MAPITFEQGIALRKLSDTTFRSLQQPWTWPRSTVVPGGILMALAANAALQTTGPGFRIDTLSCHFLSAPKANLPFDISVQRLSDGGRFCSRVATLAQADGALKVHVTVSFVRANAMTGPSMKHSVQRQSHQMVDAIELDDLAPERTELGPYMKFQRLPLLSTDDDESSQRPQRPESMIYTSAAQMSPLSATSPTDGDRGANLHTLALIALSDYHILDCPPTVHGLTGGTPAIGDTTRTPTTSAFAFMTSLNHSIRFHAHDGFRADEVLYVEANCPWTRERRAQVDSRLFSGDGKLLATCSQECYFVMKEEGEQMQRRWVMDGDQDGRAGDGVKSRL